uniref:Ovule protein n=1 Tax=Caenorhabditis tropicalis TaxID=1561998 RepID=A0A1I7UAC3_9PELO
MEKKCVAAEVSQKTVMKSLEISKNEKNSDEMKAIKNAPNIANDQSDEQHVEKKDPYDIMVELAAAYGEETECKNSK